jgi:hypothetical protein
MMLLNFIIWRVEHLPGADKSARTEGRSSLFISIIALLRIWIVFHPEGWSSIHPKVHVVCN